MNILFDNLQPTSLFSLFFFEGEIPCPISSTAQNNSGYLDLIFTEGELYRE